MHLRFKLFKNTKKAKSFFVRIFIEEKFKILDKSLGFCYLLKVVDQCSHFIMDDDSAYLK